MQQNAIEQNVITTTVRRLRSFFETGRTRPIAFRRQQLQSLLRFLSERESEIQQALRDDLGKPGLESVAVEVSFVAKEVAFTLRHLASWMRPERVATPILVQPGKSRIYPEPLGVVLIIGPWNYPLQLMLGPLVGAIAAGNCAVLKPSEVAPATSALLARFLPEYVDEDCVHVVEGGVPETTALLSEHFDHILYTGNATVGQIVMQAAAKHLTPVTLELGGKSPCIVEHDADLEVAARRILWGKFLNSGQTCVAPDYVLAHEKIEAELLRLMKKAVYDFFGEDPKASPDFARIVNNRHYRRLMDLLPGSGDVLVGGDGIENERYFAPTVLFNTPEDSPVMSQEIFGPILPVLRVKNLDEAIHFVNDRPKPLALYIFSNNGAAKKRVIAGTSSGAVLVNHTCMHAAVSALPFGGVGASGMGAYHGRASFETFSHRKAVLFKPTILDLDLLYPPYNKTKEKWIRRLA